jgi:NAD(P)H-dependent FMN reductase
MNQPRFAAFAGSVRKDSVNKKLIRLAAAAAEKAGAAVTLIDLRDYPMPLYDGDQEAREGVPETAQRLRRLLIEQDGLLIASPEYNSSVSPLLKNTIDWVTRGGKTLQEALAPFQDKVVGLYSASPGGLGGLRGLVHVRSILSSIGAFVLPDQVTIASAFEAFDEAGKLKDDALSRRVEALAQKAVRTAESVSNLYGVAGRTV